VNDVLKFANVARPVVALEDLDRFALDLGSCRFSVLLRKVLGENGDVVFAIPQWRNAKRHNVQAEEKILAELAACD